MPGKDVFMQYGDLRFSYLTLNNAFLADFFPGGPDGRIKCAHFNEVGKRGVWELSGKTAYL